MDAVRGARRYRACQTIAGRCAVSREEQRIHARTRMLACAGCEELASLPLPGATPACTGCGGAWSQDPITALPYCRSCETTEGNKAEKARERRKAKQRDDVLHEARYQQIVMEFARAVADEETVGRKVVQYAKR